MNKYIKDYEKNGYVLIKNTIPKSDCNLLYKNIMYKKLKYNKKIYKNQKEKIIFNNKNKYGSAFSKNSKYFKWKHVFNNKHLNMFFNKIYKKWNFNDKILGWVHIRFPYYNSKNIKYVQNWHIDNCIDKINYNQGPIIIPLITNTKSGGGSTIVIRESHKYIDDYVHSKKRLNINEKINNIVEKNYKNYIEITGEKGDILIMHPYLIHSSSYANKNRNIRLFFNTSISI